MIQASWEDNRQEKCTCEGNPLVQTGHSGPQIVTKLRQADVLIGQGKTVPEVCKEIGVSEQNHFHVRESHRTYSGN
jgi:hypothetical protein